MKNEKFNISIFIYLPGYELFLFWLFVPLVTPNRDLIFQFWMPTTSRNRFI